jgi:carboxylesterase type B
LQIPTAPSHLYKTAQISKVPVIIGWNNDDGSLFVSPTIVTEEEAAADLLKSFPGLTNSTVEKLFTLYPSWEFEAQPAVNASQQFLRTSRIARDITFTCQALLVADQISRQSENGQIPQASIYHSETTPPPSFFQKLLGSRGRPNQHHHHLAPPVFIYDLNQTSLAQNFSTQGFPFLGISHIADIPYVFDEVSKFNNSASNQLLAKQMSGSWTRFATSGFPSSPRGMTIQGWTPAIENGKGGLEHLRLMVIGGENLGMTGLKGRNIEIAKQRLVERCGFINSEEVQREIGV